MERIKKDKRLHLRINKKHIKILDTHIKITGQTYTSIIEGLIVELGERSGYVKPLKKIYTRRSQERRAVTKKTVLVKDDRRNQVRRKIDQKTVIKNK